MAGRTHFEMWQSKKDGQWYWSLEAANGESIAIGGEGFSSKESCRRSIRNVMEEISHTPIEVVASR